VTAGTPRVTTSAAWLAAPLADLTDRSLPGVVLAPFQRSAYLDLDGRIVALVASDVEIGPFTIVLNDFGMVREHCSTGPVVLDGGSLRIGAADIDLRAAAIWDAALPSRAASGAGAAREAAIDTLLTAAPPGSIAPLLQPGRASGPLLGPLSRGLDALADLLDDAEASDESWRDAAVKIAGRGPGLTPSGDDLLMGIVLALVVWPHLARTERIPDLLVDAARSKTTRISGAYLDAARRGWAAEPWHALIRALDDVAATRAAVRRIARVGETSGADALTGFCWAWRRLAD